MNIISDKAEDTLMRDLKLLKSKRENRRCIRFITKDIPDSVLIKTLELIEKLLKRQEVKFYICFEVVFIIAEDIHFKIFLKIKEQVYNIVSIISGVVDTEDKDIDKDIEDKYDLMSIFDLENDWHKIKWIIENIMIAKKQASKKE